MLAERAAQSLKPSGVATCQLRDVDDSDSSTTLPVCAGRAQLSPRTVEV